MSDSIKLEVHTDVLAECEPSQNGGGYCYWLETKKLSLSMGAQKMEVYIDSGGNMQLSVNGE